MVTSAHGGLSGPAAGCLLIYLRCAAAEGLSYLIVSPSHTYLRK